MTGTVAVSDQIAKDPKLRLADVQQLREWLKKQPHLPQALPDEYLVATIHSSEYSVEQAKQLLVANVTSRTNYVEIFHNRDPLAKDKQAIWDLLNLWVSTNVTKDKHRILFGGLKNYDPELFNFPSLLSVFVSVVDTTIQELGVCPGYVIVLDCRGVTLSHLARANVSLIRDILNFVQDAVLIKIKAIHVIFVSPVIDKIMFVVKPFLRKALLDILYFHTGEMKDFYNEVPRELLPPEIGGTWSSHKQLNELSRDRLERQRDWLKETERWVIDESKAPDNKKDNYSVAGSFRKLQLD
ncbi:alpha-tocopherol transfer protein-like [Macrosteles quadrilineatus]|uniref:alpha-tocopherol transfer protein-like n=1 Tax=Macrosteles quadrilineatus TaxID=74068 RepID=UPI0023E18DE2|nr:alpha-tocopherol transfer protein-like [Macrosteles quadrilineatus]XP_054286235.1 alpha-tocopherol transfer protein-like [Macrosteles quadrilineatus]XP_054286236.1 alpha-tocopherol transfer protein-like [Macrosteles quadrilineatus]